VPGRILLVDDVAELRTVVRRALALRGGLDVVAEAGDGATAVALAEEHQPDVVVLDLGLPDLAGREVLSRLRRAAPAAQVVVFTGTHTPDRDEVVREADAFVEKGRDVSYLVELLADLSRRVHRSASIRLSGTLSDIPAARRFLVQQCDEWDCGISIAEAEVVISELVTNAVIHASSAVEIRLALVGGMLRIEVADHGGGLPDVRAPGPDDAHGRGLVLVNGLSSAWGVEPLADGKCVWAELSAPEPVAL
jgi:CheY-like chemotaxis protein/anti-sigma regulatory factor (Ser/Thr protein kinase)